MSEPAYKRVLAQLGATEIDVRLQSVRDRVISRAHGDLAREVLKEMASALGRAERKVTNAIERANAEARSIDGMLAERPAPEDRIAPAWTRAINARIDAFNAHCEAADVALWELRVHREALGFLRNETLAQEYPIPPRRAKIA